MVIDDAGVEGNPGGEFVLHHADRFVQRGANAQLKEHVRGQRGDVAQHHLGFLDVLDDLGVDNVGALGQGANRGEAGLW